MLGSKYPEVLTRYCWQCFVPLNISVEFWDVFCVLGLNGLRNNLFVCFKGGMGTWACPGCLTNVSVFAEIPKLWILSEPLQWFGNPDLILIKEKPVQEWILANSKFIFVKRSDEQLNIDIWVQATLDQSFVQLTDANDHRHQHGCLSGL